MKAGDHYQKGLRLEEGQHQLDVVTAVELVIEGCYMAAHHYIEAGAEWLGVPHPQSHAHKDNIDCSVRLKHYQLSPMLGMF